MNKIECVFLDEKEEEKDGRRRKRGEYIEKGEKVGMEERPKSLVTSKTCQASTRRAPVHPTTHQRGASQNQFMSRGNFQL